MASSTDSRDRLPRLAERTRAEHWNAATIRLTLVRTLAQGTWLQVLPLYDELRDEPDGRVGRPRHISSRMLALGAFPIGPRELWGRRDRPVLDRVERLHRSIDDPSGLPDTQPLLVDIETAPCTPGWTIATATGDVLADVTQPGPSVPVRVEAPVGAEWTVSVPHIGRAQGTGDRPRPFGPFPSDVPGLVSGSVSGDPYECEGVERGSVAWRPATRRGRELPGAGRRGCVRHVRHAAGARWPHARKLDLRAPLAAARPRGRRVPLPLLSRGAPVQDDGALLGGSRRGDASTYRPRPSRIGRALAGPADRLVCREAVA